MKKVSRVPQKTRTVPVNTVSPTKGLNTIDSLGMMDPQYALVCQNFIAAPQGLAVRRGNKAWTPGNRVGSIVPYYNVITSKLFSISGEDIIDSTNIGTATVVGSTGSTNDDWRFATQTSSTAGTSFLMMVNGESLPMMYDGLTWFECSQTATPTVPGEFKDVDTNSNPVDISTFVDIVLHKQRLWFVDSGSTTAYYADIAASAGDLAPFDFGPLFPRGGALHRLHSWSSDVGGNLGAQSLLVAISSIGDVAIFSGSNPADAADWQLAAQYSLGAPVGMNCTASFQGDMLYLSQDGLYPMSKYMASSRGKVTDALTYAISPTINDLVATYGSLPGFSITVHPSSSLLILNVPQVLESDNFQFIYNTLTNGWSQFTGWAATCFAVYNDALYFGAENGLRLAFYGYTDGADMDGANGSTYTANALQAYNHFQDFPGLGYGSIKQAVAVRPFLVTGDSAPSLRIGVNTDYNLIAQVGTNGTSPLVGAIWDVSEWDDPTTTWAGSLGTFNQWATPLCWPGEALAFAISISADSETMWVSTSWLIEPGGQFG